MAMALPDAVQNVIDEEAATISEASLRQAAAELGRLYAAASSPQITSLPQRLAYLIARMPAVFEVNLAAASELQRLRPALKVHSVLDVGCGPGTATIAMRQVFGPLEFATLADHDQKWFTLTRRLIGADDPNLAASSHFTAFDADSPGTVGEHDLVVLSYVAGELAPAAAQRMVNVAWMRTRRVMAIIEPGTPRGFAAVLAARDALLAAGAGMVAPCTHGGKCPLASGDWCHFDMRIERSRRHRQVKSGTRSYEIEKFSYLIVEKSPPTMHTRAARIIRHPLKKSGHVILDLCTSKARAQRLIIARRDRERYRLARAAKWGGLWEVADGTEA